MSSIVLTPDQKEAEQKFKSFLVSDQKYFYLFGKAGSGKTFLLRYLLENTLKEYKNCCKILGIKPVFNTVALTAPTHKALTVLSSGFESYDDYPTKICTTYQFYDLVVKDDYDTGKSYLKNKTLKALNSTKKENCLLIVDECSMLPQDMVERIEIDSKTHKVIFVGDNNQLPPVGEKPYFTDTPEDYTAVLTSSVRNKNQEALRNVCAQLRDSVDSLSFSPISIVPGVIDLLDDDQALEWLKTADYTKNRVLSYTNNKTNKYADLVDMLLGITVENKYDKGRNYIVNNTIYSDNRVTFYSEEEVVIRWIGSTRFDEEHHLPVMSVTISALHDPDKEATFDLVKDTNAYRQKLRHYAEQTNWYKYFDLKKNYLDLRSPYSSTIHKAQGSTFDEVLIDLTSFRSCKSDIEAARLLYVAFTRAKNRIVLYGKLPKKYGGINAGTVDH